MTVKSRLRERRNRVTVNADSSESEESQASSVHPVQRRRRSLRRDDSSDESSRRRPMADKGKVYHLRQNKPAVERFQVANNNSELFTNFIYENKKTFVVLQKKKKSKTNVY